MHLKLKNQNFQKWALDPPLPTNANFSTRCAWQVFIDFKISGSIYSYQKILEISSEKQTFWTFEWCTRKMTEILQLNAERSGYQIKSNKIISSIKTEEELVAMVSPLVCTVIKINKISKDHQLIRPESTKGIAQK